MKFFHLVSIATYIVLCNASYVLITQLSDVTTGVGYEVEFLCRLNTTQQEDNFHRYIVWSVDGVKVESESTNGMYTISELIPVIVSIGNTVFTRIVALGRKLILTIIWCFHFHDFSRKSI